ncbi:MAG: ribosome maturation factor RimP [Spirulinaceae cyanobacterium RM2_2_10]|nr:ribosome maturation factor RimP [Spirulinaceae cyanobacterium SM2_1_0]NJO19837.1 ribosome maturation factor RimP [Spirulinaceae cyanobacterium RM2_2_10]
MTHPLVPHILDLAAPVAAQLDLELVGAMFQTGKQPPVLRVDIRNPTADTSLDDCERMSRALEAHLDASDLIPDAYVLEVSSPGTSRQLSTEREFEVFQGFVVTVKTYAPHQGKKEWQGCLSGRDAEHVYINQKGRSIAIPRQLVASIQLTEAD